MAAKIRRFTQLVGILLLATPLVVQANARPQDMPGMQMPAKPVTPTANAGTRAPHQNAPTKNAPPGAPQPKMQDMPDMKMPMDEGQKMQDMPGMKMSGGKMNMTDDMQDLPAGPAMKLGDLEQMAISRNPTLSQAKADVRAAEGAKRQAGFYPNPTVGYYGDEIRGGSFHTGKEGAFISQTIVLGGKLGAARQTAEQGRLLAVTNADVQRYKVQNDIRGIYYEVLAAQRLVQVRRQLLTLATDAVETSHQLGNVGQADRPDVLQAEIEAEQAELALDSAKKDYESLWRTLTATAGDTSLPLGRVEGNLDDVPQLDQTEWVAKMLSDSPLVKVAQQESARAAASLREARKAPIPDIQFNANVSQDNEPLEPSLKRTGIVSGAQVGIQVPLFNRNQGNIASARADLERSQAEIQRVQLDLARQVSSLFRDYASARSVADRYRTRMLPRAQKAYELYKDNYQNMAAAYPQVLIAQRTFFQLQVDYIDSLRTAWRNAIQIQGFGLSDGLSALSSAGKGSSTSSPMSGSMSGGLTGSAAGQTR